MNKHSVTIRGLRVVTTCWSWAWSDRTSPSKWVGLDSQLAASSVYGDLTCSAHTVNNLCMFNCQFHFYLCNRGPYVRLAFNLFIFYRNTKVTWKMLCHRIILFIQQIEWYHFFLENMISFGSVKMAKSTTTQYQNRRFECSILQCIVESNYYFWQR